MSTFSSVNTARLQKAFALAHKASEDEQYSPSTQKAFRAVAMEIWNAHGEEGTPKAGIGAELLDKGTAPDAL